MAKPFLQLRGLNLKRFTIRSTQATGLLEWWGDMLKKISTIQNLTKDGVTPVQCA